MEDQPQTNSFADVHKKAKAFRDRLAEVSKNEADVRESRLVREATNILDPEPK